MVSTLEGMYICTNVDTIFFIYLVFGEDWAHTYYLQIHKYIDLHTKNFLHCEHMYVCTYHT